MENFADGALSLREAVAFSGLSRSELYRAMERGDLAFAIYGRRRLVPRAALVALLARGRARTSGR
jgi:hypothetical protein